MIQKGLWVGQYRFDNEAHNEARGFDFTGFEIEIREISGNNFCGKVQDDQSTGGMEGVGEISGTFTGEYIEFIKQMPVMTLLIDKKGAKRTLNKKHRKIYYTGRISDGRTISGKWRFKFGFIWWGLIPVPIIPSRGTWVMSIIDKETYE